MTDDSLTLTADDYRALDPIDKAAFDLWVDEVRGGYWDANAIHLMVLGEGTATFTEYLFGDDGMPLHDGRGYHLQEVRFPARRPPPVWKPLR